MNIAPAVLEQVLHDEIPLTRALGLRVQAYTGTELVLGAPLAGNTNHKSTAFGGSLYSAAVLAGWGLLYLRLREAEVAAQVVIQESQVSYRRPVAGDFTAVCSLAKGEPAWVRALAQLKRRGRARIALDSEIRCQDAAAVIFHGRYVLSGSDPGSS